MEPSPHVVVRIDLARVRRNAEAVARAAGVPVIAVVKADAYGLGAEAVAKAVGDLVDGFYVFDAAEAARARLFELTGKPTIALHGDSTDPADYRSIGVRPAVWTADRAAALRQARPVLSIDTGQQRFGVPLDGAEDVRRAGDCDEAFTHATTVQQAVALRDALRGRVARLHAAASSLLAEPAARLDAVRPGLALYLGAARVSARLVEVHDSAGPAGYGGFVVPRHGVIRCGYANGLHPGGPCLVNGRRSHVLEVGMQSAFVECAPTDRAGDEVVLLGDGLTEDDVAKAWGVSPHSVLVHLTATGARTYPFD